MVYKLINNDDQDNIVHLVQRSQMKYKSTMYLNLFDRHFSYIKDMKLYSNSYQCRTCDKIWPTAYLLQRHEQTCDDRTKYQYPGGVYHPAATVFEKLELEGINIPAELRCFPYRATFDFETYQESSNLPQETASSQWIGEHIPLSVSICSNVPGYERPVCFVTDGDAKKTYDQLSSRHQCHSCGIEKTTTSAIYRPHRSNGEDTEVFGSSIQRWNMSSS